MGDSGLALKDIARQKIRDLVDKFRHDPLATTYHEAQIYKDYVLPLFAILGWDVNSREVSIEERVGRKRADFGFYIKTEARGYLPVFYLEIKHNQHPLTAENHQQATNYAYLKGITWAVLTNFAELAVHNAEFPREFFRLSYTDYAEDSFEDLWLLSKSSFEKNLLDKKAESYGVKAKRKPVTEKLFDQLVRWRKELFDEFRNTTSYSNIQIDNAIQLLFDRFIFIRSMEDREIEPYPPKLLQIANQGTPRLSFHVKDEKKFNQDLHALFNDLRDVYNSNLFDFSIIDEFEFKTSVAQMIKGLYTSDFVKYDFEVITADILGSVYEQYLSFRAQDPSAKDTLKSLKRKTQGIYYTPQFIVKYIVAYTVGKALKNHPAPLNIRILDPACGSGSFLIEVFDFLDAYFKPLIPDEKARHHHILTENLYGVDLDEQATEVTRLNLLLRATSERDRLPRLRHIKIGNTLQDTTDFSWHIAFRDIFDAGGFDVIVGNPPYVRQETLGNAFKQYLQTAYPQVFAGTADLYVYFIQRGLSLLKSSGQLGYVLPNKWLCTNYGRPLRKFLKSVAINHLIDFGTSPVFPNADVNACLLFLENAPANTDIDVIDPQAFLDTTDIDDTYEKPSMQICSSDFIARHQYAITRQHLRLDGWTLTRNDAQVILNRLLTVGTPLGEIVKGNIHWGVKTGYDAAFVIDKTTRDLFIQQDPNSADIIKPYLTVDKRKEMRYAPPVAKKYLIRLENGWTRKHLTEGKDAFALLQETYPAIANYLVQHQDNAQARSDQGEYWWELRPCAYYDQFDTPKIVYPEVGKRGQFTLDLNNHYLNATLFMITGLPLDEYYYLLGIFNSTLFTLISRHVVCRALSGSLRWKAQYMRKMPIPDADVRQREKMIELVKTQLELHAKYEALHITDSNRRSDIRDNIEQTDRAIDNLVAELYGLTKQEMMVIINTSSL